MRAGAPMTEATPCVPAAADRCVVPVAAVRAPPKLPATALVSPAWQPPAALGDGEAAARWLDRSLVLPAPQPPRQGPRRAPPPWPALALPVLSIGLMVAAEEPIQSLAISQAPARSLLDNFRFVWTFGCAGAVSTPTSPRRQEEGGSARIRTSMHAWASLGRGRRSS